MKISNDNNVLCFLDIFISLGTLPMCIVPTRVTNTSNTLIDNILVKCDGYEAIKSRTLVSYISDHFPIITWVINLYKSLDNR